MLVCVESDDVGLTGLSGETGDLGHNGLPGQQGQRGSPGIAIMSQRGPTGLKGQSYLIHQFEQLHRILQKNWIFKQCYLVICYHLVCPRETFRVRSPFRPRSKILSSCWIFYLDKTVNDVEDDYQTSVGHEF